MTRTTDHVSRLVLHIGLSKTGTTAFQEFAAGNAERLAAHGLAYAEMLRGPNHSQLAVAFSAQINQITASHGVENERDRARLRRRVMRRLARGADAAPAWLVSSEQLSTMLRGPRIAELAAALHEVFDDITVVAAVRRADYWLPSAYVEAIARGGTRPMDAQFVRRREPLLRHPRLLRRWARAFGPGNVLAVPYLEQDKHEPTALPTRLLTAAGLPASVVAGWPSPPGIRNPSLSAEAVEMLRQLNPRLELSALRPVSSRRTLAERVGERHPGRPPQLSPEAADYLRGHGLVLSGIAKSKFASGPGWDQWPRQPAAPTAPPPILDRQDVECLGAELLEEGRIDAALPAAVASPLRRMLIRATRR
jgi:hypothetical protein